MAAQTAAEIVALARNVAPEIRRCRFDNGWHVAVHADGRISALPPKMTGRTDAVMTTTLTRENTASEEALVRALVASAVEYRELPTSGWIAYLGEMWAPAGAGNRKSCAALLDALLATPEART